MPEASMTYLLGSGQLTECKTNDRFPNFMTVSGRSANGPAHAVHRIISRSSRLAAAMGGRRILARAGENAADDERVHQAAPSI